MFVIRNLMLVVMAMGLTFAATAQQEQTGQQEAIPVEINDFIEQHFPATQIVGAEKNNDTYTIELSGDTDLKFNEKYEITSISSSSQLPESVIPDSLQAYASVQYADLQITGWKLVDNQQTLTLNDSTELVFDTDGNFVR